MRSILVLLAAAAAAAEDKTHVVVAGSGSHALGVVACVRSVFEGALNQVKVHVIVQQKDVSDFSAALRCALPQEDWRVVPWEDDRVARLVSVRHGKKGYLAHALNYARFYLRDILGPGVEKALWLDSDTVVIGDITSMTNNALTTNNHAVADDRVSVVDLAALDSHNGVRVAAEGGRRPVTSADATIAG